MTPRMLTESKLSSGKSNATFFAIARSFTLAGTLVLVGPHHVRVQVDPDALLQSRRSH